MIIVSGLLKRMVFLRFYKTVRIFMFIIYLLKWLPHFMPALLYTEDSSTPIKHYSTFAWVFLGCNGFVFGLSKSKKSMTSWFFANTKVHSNHHRKPTIAKTIIPIIANMPPFIISSFIVELLGIRLLTITPDFDKISKIQEVKYLLRTRIPL